MIAVDTSVVVAAFASWHEGHSAAIDAMRAGSRLPAHVAIESYSVLTRLPPPHRAPADIVVAFLEARFPEALLTLPEGENWRLLREALASGMTGGSIYDALVAATALHAGARLLTRDHRAISVYQSVGVTFELVR